MASKGLSSSIYQTTQNNIVSSTDRIPRTPLFAIPVVICCFLISYNQSSEWVRSAEW